MTTPTTSSSHLSASSRDLIQSLATPERIQAHIDHHLLYDPDREDRSVEQVIQDNKGECFNGSLLAAACLLEAGFACWLVRLAARAGDEEHILCVYKQDGCYGSIAQSKFLGLKGRLPMYATIHDLVVSYLEFYFSFEGAYSLQAYSEPFDLVNFGDDWLNSSAAVEEIGQRLKTSPHHDLVAADAPLFYVTPERFWKEVLVIPPGTIIPAAYLAARPT